MGDREIYGWGMVNAGKAVQGYATFVSDVAINTQGYAATFGNDINGAGSLTKTGAGMLTMTGASTYTGGTLVDGGGLSVNGSLGALVVVGQNGTLRGTGTINAPLSVAGRVAPGNSAGTLTVAGPVFLASTAMAQFDIDGTGTATGAGNYSRLVTTGTTGRVQVDGTLVAATRGITGDASNTYVAPLGTQFNIIQSSAGVSGSFDRLTQSGAGLDRATRFDTVYSQTGVSLAVTPDAYGNLSDNGLETTDNQDAVGAALDALRPTAGTRTNPLFAGLYSTGAGALSSALGQLSGEIHASATALQVTRATALQDTIGERIRNAFEVDAFDERATFWTSAYGGGGSVDGNGVGTFDWDMANVLFGMDMPVGDASLVGLAAGTGHSNGDVDDTNASVSANHYDIAVYGATSFEAIDLSIGASHSWSSLDTNRSPSFGGFTDTLTSSYRARTAQAFGELGYRATVGEIELKPFVSAAHLAVSGSAFDENGGSAALSGKVADRNLGLTVTGLRVSTDFELGQGKLKTSAMLGWQRLYGDRQGSADVTFAGGTPFAIAGVTLARDALRIELGADYSVNTRVNLGIGYRGTFAGSSNSSSVRGDFKLAF
ncbi:hypothetical protein AX761_10665 [Rhizobium sp. 58]|nr:hypothetical protein AX761_10665 [Rhizobium sp. 58]